MPFSPATTGTAGVLLLAIVFIESGGLFMLRVMRGRVPATEFQRAFYRAGHAHAGVLVTLALVCQIFADAVPTASLLGSVARDGVPVAAILMPAGFFLSALGPGRTGPNGLVALLYLGAASLALGVSALGFALLTH